MKTRTFITYCGVVTVFGLIGFMEAFLSTSRGGGLYSTTMTPAQWVSEKFPFHLVPVDWVVLPSDTLQEATSRWWLAETRARAMVIVVCWALVIGALAWYFFTQKERGARSKS